MTKLTLILAATSVIAVAADLPFTGTWRTILPDREIVIQNGTFLCADCGVVKPEPMDGKEHANTRGLAGATRSITVIDGKTIENVNLAKGVVVGRTLRWVSADGNRQTMLRIAYPDGGVGADWQSTAWVRVGKAASGVHPVAGTWRNLPELNRSADGERAVSYVQSADGLKLTEGSTSYDAKFDDRDYPVKGSSNQTVHVKRINANTIDETWKRDGKEVFRGHMVVSADGKTMTQTNFEGGKQVGLPSTSTRVAGAK